jgi:hypothetical protein
MDFMEKLLREIMHLRNGWAGEKVCENTLNNGKRSGRWRLDAGLEK